MGRGTTCVGWGAALFALSLAWEACIYFAQAWPIYHPFVGMSIGALFVVIGLVVSVVGWFRHPATSDAEPHTATDEKAR